MQNYQYISISLFSLGMIGYLVNIEHVLLMLLMLEFMMLGILIMLSLSLSMIFVEWLILIILFFVVCESVIGISSVVLMSRSHGHDLLNNMNLLQC